MCTRPRLSAPTLPLEAPLSRWYATLVCLLVCATVSSPVLYHYTDDLVKDSFPLSWYPMFRNPRKDIETVYHVVAIDEKGARHKVPYPYWASGGFNQGRNQLKRIVKKGKARSLETCEAIAKRIERKGLEADGKEVEGVVEVVILVSRWDRDAYFSDGKREPERAGLAAQCRVGGEPEQ